MNPTNNRTPGRARFVRVMLQLSPQCELPDFVTDAEYFPLDIATATVRFDMLDELERHAGVRGLWLQSGERLERKHRDDASLSVELQVPAELAGQLAPLFPGLVANGARRLEVFSYARPGESPFWLAFIIAPEGRHTVGTPDLRHLALEDQVPELLRQLEGWAPLANL